MANQPLSTSPSPPPLPISDNNAFLLLLLLHYRIHVHFHDLQYFSGKPISRTRLQYNHVLTYVCEPCFTFSYIGASHFGHEEAKRIRTARLSNFNEGKGKGNNEVIEIVITRTRGRSRLKKPLGVRIQWEIKKGLDRR